MRSLRRTALLWMTAVITGVGLAGAVIAYVLALREANSFMDGQLRQIALNAGPGLRNSRSCCRRHDPEDDLVVQIWNAARRLSIQPVPTGVDIPAPAALRVRDVEALGTALAVFTSSDAARTIQVSQQVEVRRELAESAALQAAIPILFIDPGRAGWSSDGPWGGCWPI